MKCSLIEAKIAFEESRKLGDFEAFKTEGRLLGGIAEDIRFLIDEPSKGEFRGHYCDYTEEVSYKIAEYILKKAGIVYEQRGNL